MPAPRDGRVRQLGELVDPLRGRTGTHLPPARAHLRAAKEDYRAQAPPDARFSRKLAAFLRNQFWGWLWSYVRFCFGPRHRFQSYSGTGEAEQIAELIESVAPHFTIHLGDVYYVGDEEEMKTNCLGQAPVGSDVRGVCWPPGSVGSFALNGNHEMYANGKA